MCPIFWHFIWPLRSSGAHWAGQVPGWGPAMHTELGRSQVEVQRCTLSWEDPKLKSSDAYWARKVPGWGPAVPTEQVPGWGPAMHTEFGRSQVEVQRCTLSWEGPRLRSSDVYWARKVPGWGPAVPTEQVPGWGPAMNIEFGRSQVEVQRCVLSWEIGKELGEESWQRACRIVGKPEVEVESDADMVEEKLEEEEEETRKRRKTTSRGGGKQLW